MDRVEVVEPRVERRHALTSVELVSHSALRERRHVQPRGAGLFVEVVGEADVPAGHTQRIHIAVVTARTFSRNPLRASVVTLLLAAVLSTAYSFIYTPRFTFWLAFGLVMFAGVASTWSWSPRAIATFYGVALGAFAVDAIIERIAASARDYSSLPLSGARLLAYLGSASLAILVVAYFDPVRRSQLGQDVAPRSSLDPLRATAMVALAALALAPIIRSFTSDWVRVTGYLRSSTR